MKSSCHISLALAAVAAQLASAAVIHVPGDLPTIQAAISAANNGDTVLVAPGTYREHINFLGKAIAVTSSGGANATIIDGGSTATVVTFSSGETRSSVLSGFTITNGFSTFGGGGIEISSSSPTILKNIIKTNRACDGSGIEVTFGSPSIRGNRIIGNRQEGCSGGTGGGGIEIGGAAGAHLIGNLIMDNSTGVAGGGISLFAAGTPVIANNAFVNNSANQGGAISMANQSDATVVQNLFITNNAADAGGAVYYLVPSGAAGPTFVNNTFYRNVADTGSTIYANDFDVPSRFYNNIVTALGNQPAIYCGNLNSTTPPQFFNNDVITSGGQGYGGICSDQTGSNGNISADPLFVQPAQNLRLQPGSPSIDAGTNAAPYLPAKDLDGNPRLVAGTVDMGAYEFQGIE